ncbi:MAG: acyl-CoA dehydrogenase family protein [Halomonas subglaciescola]|nr:acyl-CoA dehydrogenase family protein [Halomonas subglaciescola]
MNKASAPGLNTPTETHAVRNQATPLEKHNLYRGDTALMEAVEREQAGWAQEDLCRYGAICGDPEVIRWGFEANAQPPHFDSHDRFGHRVDEVVYHASYHRLMAMALREGLHAAPWNAPGPGAHVARAAKYYLHSQLEAAHCCPITMTFAAVPSLRLTPEIAEQWLPRVLACDYDPRNTDAAHKSALTLGMGMTEKQGGSDVRANTTSARPAGAGASGAAYELVGHKWFLSAPMCDAFLMLAQAPEGLSCFLVPRWRRDGDKNAVQIQRLKDKLGNRANASSEVELRGAEGWLIGAAGRGVPAIIEMVAMTRFDCMLGSSAAQHQAVIQAVHHARQRQVFGKTLIEQPLMRNVLADLQLEAEGSLALTMRMARALDNADDPHEKALIRLGTAVGKYWICKRTPGHSHEAMECIGGNGVIENCIMPRLYREAPINAIWEGSGNVQALDVLRALDKNPATLEAWWQEIQPWAPSHTTLNQAVEALKKAFADTQQREFRARYLVDRLALIMQGALLRRTGNDQLADAFIRSRLGNAGDRHYGTLPTGLAIDELLQRAAPWPA